MKKNKVFAFDGENYRMFRCYASKNLRGGPGQPAAHYSPITATAAFRKCHRYLIIPTKTVRTAEAVYLQIIIKIVIIVVVEIRVTVFFNT